MRCTVIALMLLSSLAYGQQTLTGAKPVMIEPSTGKLNYPDMAISNLTISGGITVTNNWGYDDLRFPAISLRTQGAANVPDFSSFTGGLYLFAFDGSTMQQIYGVAQFPHTWRTNSAIMPHVHVNSGSSTSTNGSVWKLEYTWTNIGATNLTATTTIATTNAWPGVAWRHSMWDFPHIDGTGKTESSIMVFRLYRDPTDAGDINTADEFLYEFDIHYQIEKISGEVYN